MIQLHHGDCLEILKHIPDNSIDLILTDPPYGTTACKWDSVIPFEPMWKELKRVRKDNAAIVLFGGNPFQANLIMSNIDEFKYEWIWDKMVGANFAVLKYQPMREHESISVFSKKSHKYYPIKQERSGSGKNRAKYPSTSSGVEQNYNIDRSTQQNKMYDQNLRFPRSIQAFTSREDKETRGLHPTQKPVPLLEYLIKTYTQPGELVLDFTMGSGSTGVACINTGRDFVGIEMDEMYFNIAKNRIDNTQLSLSMI